MLERDPEYSLMKLLQENWQGDEDDLPPERISDGWWDESDDGHQVTVTHYDSTVDGETGYTSVAGDGSLQSQVDGRLDVNVWIAYNDDFSSMGGAKDLRWEAEREVRRIVSESQQDGSSPFQALGLYETERKMEEGSPTLFRSRIRLHAVYIQKF